MKKLLSILAAVGLTATASSAVVACSNSADKGVDNKTNNPSAKYSDFTGWVEDSKKGNCELVFIGGRKDSASLSFLAAREKAAGENVNTTGKTGYEELIKADNLKKYDSKFTDNKDIQKSLSDVYSSAAVIDASKFPGLQGNLQKLYWGDDKVQKADAVTNLVLHSILVDDLSTFWTNGLGSTGIINKFIKDQAKVMVDFYHVSTGRPIIKIGKETEQDVKDREVDTVVKGITASLKAETTGPFFLVIDNGKLLGITKGYKNYKQFNKDAKDSLDSANVSEDMSKLLWNIHDNVWEKLTSWTEADWYPVSSDFKSLTVSNGAGSKTGWTDDDIKNVTYTPKVSTTETYALDLKKYID